MIRMKRPMALAAGVAAFLIAAHSLAEPLQRKKKQEDVTQTLEVLPEPPAALAAETGRLAFVVAPMTAKGLMSQQAREALKSLAGQARGARFVRIRALVAGTGDLRRIQTIVSEELSERKLSLPVLTVVQVGGLPLEGAQVLMEAVVEQKKAKRGAGLVVASGRGANGREALEKLSAAFKAAGGGEPLRLSCAVASGEMQSEARASAAEVFPALPAAIYQAQRLPAEAGAVCEGFAAPGATAGVARVVFAGSQLAFRYQAADARLAYQRLEKTLAGAGTSLKRALVLNVYPLSPQMAVLAASVQSEFVSGAPAGVSVPHEGLPSIDASFALEAIAEAGAGT